jgi:hypothetical protein
MWRHVQWHTYTKISEEHKASVFRIIQIINHAEYVGKKLLRNVGICYRSTRRDIPEEENILSKSFIYQQMHFISVLQTNKIYIKT